MGYPGKGGGGGVADDNCFVAVVVFEADTVGDGWFALKAACPKSTLSMLTLRRLLLFI